MIQIIHNRDYIFLLTRAEILEILQYNRFKNKKWQHFTGYSKMSKEEMLKMLLNIYDNNIKIYDNL